MRGSWYHRMDTLSTEQKACFSDIRTLCIRAGQSGPAHNMRLTDLLRLLQDDQLVEFSGTTDIPLSKAQLLTLLRSQSRLTRLRARPDLTTYSSGDMTSDFPELCCLLTLITQPLKTLRIYIGQTTTESAEYGEALHHLEIIYNGLVLKAAMKLSSLELYGWYDAAMSETRTVHLHPAFAHTTFSNSIPRTLSSLLLIDFDFSGVEDNLSGAIDWTSLSTLKLESCDNMGPFLRMLAVCFQKQSGSSLRILTVRTSYHEFKSKKTACMDHWTISWGLSKVSRNSELVPGGLSMGAGKPAWASIGTWRSYISAIGHSMDLAMGRR